ncbi:unnamed protein product [Amoebophrya sp. A25]|nr:unnamed protein product [Amoebophrya sp. A25]|eukprot:GSA25T00016230001.1
MATVTKFSSTMNFRRRKEMRERDAEKFAVLQASKTREDTLKALNAFDLRVEEIERENELAKMSGLSNKSGKQIAQKEEEKPKPRRGIIPAGDNSGNDAKKGDPRAEEMHKLSLYKPHIAEESFRHDYGDASRQLIAVNALQRQHRSGEPVISNGRFLTNFPCGAQPTWNLMEPIYLRPTVACQRPVPHEVIEHQPMMRPISFSERERENEVALRELFEKNKVSGLKGMTNAYGIQYSFTYQTLNRQRIMQAIEAQRCYDGRRGYNFKDMSAAHFEWLEKNASFREANEVWLDRNKSTWSDFQKKVWEILAILHRDYFKSEKKNLRMFFLQRGKESDVKHHVVPYAPENGYVLDGPRMLANLELWGVVNTKNRPTLTEDEMYGFLQLVGEHYDGAVSYEAMRKVMGKVRCLYPSHERAKLRSLNAQLMMMKERGKALEGCAVSNYVASRFRRSRFVAECGAPGMPTNEMEATGMTTTERPSSA